MIGSRVEALIYVTSPRLRHGSHVRARRCHASKRQKRVATPQVGVGAHERNEVCYSRATGIAAPHDTGRPAVAQMPRLALHACPRTREARVVARDVYAM